jgi:hypothetical protein
MHADADNAVVGNEGELADSLLGSYALAAGHAGHMLFCKLISTCEGSPDENTLFTSV